MIAVGFGCSDGSSTSPTTTPSPSIATTTTLARQASLSELFEGEFPPDEVACLEAAVDPATVRALDGGSPPFPADVARDVGGAISACLGSASRRSVFESIIGIPSSRTATEADWEVIRCLTRELPALIDVGEMYEALLAGEIDTVERQIHDASERLVPTCGHLGT
jgi:hypothetical protein